MVRATRPVTFQDITKSDLIIKERKAFAGWLSANAIAVLFLVAIYQAWQLSPGLSLAIFCLANLAWLIKYFRVLIDLVKTFFEPSEIIACCYAAIAVALDVLILIFYARSASDASLVTIWQVIPWPVFLFFALASLYVLLACLKLRPPHAWVLAGLHTFVTLAAISFVYVNGFGYDFFVHEATIAYIHAHGSILPKRPFYIGAYVMVLPWVELLKIYVGSIQKWFLPILASVLLPTTLYVLRDRFKVVPYWAIWLTLFASFTFTVPYNVALLLAVTALVLVHFDRACWPSALLVSLAAACAHPLIGLPVAAIVVLHAVPFKFMKSWLVSALLVFSAVLIPLLVYLKTSGGTLLAPSWAALIDSARIILSSPAVFSLEHPFWSSLFAVYALWPLSLFVLGLIGLRKSKDAKILYGAAFALLASAVITASMFRYRDIVSREQYEYSFRLVGLIPWIVFPGLIILASDVYEKTSQKIQAVWIGILTLLMLAAWYIAYPQFNPAMPYYAPSVGHDEIASAEWIETALPKTEHVVLAPQLVSAGALRLVGFGPSIETKDGPIYNYAIPTGGTLYGYYLNIMSGEDLTKTLSQLKSYARAPQYVFVIPSSWDPYGVFEKYFDSLAVRQTRIGDYGIFIVDSSRM